ncbi:hypothetical protein Metev_2273 (plasmid) [Methanohalobium evestigatum Z-7303]|uniref:DUF6036 domain-containing protein n=1 Tax=Methanohalobium evestigatum (strain ATCC BAA-1072 / DSM 3721 / NBRC 107634 / OCM 161 / Z-7303) TaxID=644295 RepID=D7EBW9_METEZ|nr:DUF6036 family nucleotidyltransferase [Methanohalobium evestigatum]ADI75091.1 hypothetical protein Metev_2273 [Methanohalobium evestigatum Z-7303]
MAKFSRSYLEEELEKLDRHLENPVVLYLIGGGAMSFQKLKDATKDIDVVVLSVDELKSLKKSLSSLGYKKPHLSDEYNKLSANLILENIDGFRWDIFVKVVCNGLQLSTGMKCRSIKIFDLTNISVYSITPEDIFIFKSITSREHDLLDMYTLFSSGLDFEIIKDEIIWQNENRSTEFAWVAYFYTGFEEFLDEYNLSHPLFSDLRDMAYENMMEQMIIDLLKEKPSDLETVSTRLNVNKKETDKILKNLLAKDIIEKTASSCYKNKN